MGEKLGFITLKVRQYIQEDLTLVYEYEEIADTNALKEYVITTSSLHPYFKRDWDKLKARHYCGIIHHNAKDSYILPRIVMQTSKYLSICSLMPMI